MMDREKIEMEIADLRRARGFALLHGKKYDDAPIIKLQNQLDALADIEAARTQEVLEQSAKATEAEIIAVKTEIADLTAASTKALANAEAKLREAVAAQQLCHTHERAKRKAIAKLNQLTGEKAPIENEMELHRKGSLRWMALIKTITGNPGRYGTLEYPGLTLPDPNKSWT
jgi:hypothetical protein